MDDNVVRAIELMEIAANFILEYASDSPVNYDEAECDGYCLYEDLLVAAESLRESK